MEFPVDFALKCAKLEIKKRKINFKFSREDADDIMYHAILFAVRQWVRFDPSKTNADGWVYRCVSWGVRDAIGVATSMSCVKTHRTERQRRREAGEPAFANVDSYDDLAHGITNEDSHRAFLAKQILDNEKSLTQKERHIANLMISGQFNNMTDIAIHVGQTHQNVACHMKSIARKFERRTA